MSEIVTLNSNTELSEVFDHYTLRRFEENGRLWFCLADIGKVLDLSESTTRVMKNRNWFDDDELVNVTNSNGGYDLTYVSESALFRILNRSNSPKARPFERWVTKEVLPSIRKTGSYAVTKTPIERIFQYSTNQLETAKAVAAMLELEEKKHQEAIAAEQNIRNSVYNALNEIKQDYVGLYSTFIDNSSWSDMREVSAKLNIKGFGRNKIFQLLRDKGILDKSNIPYRKYIDNGYFKLSDAVRTTKNGKMRFNKLMVSNAGKVFIEKLLRKLKE